LGFGGGAFLGVAERFNFELYGLEISESLCRLARDKYQANVFCGDVKNAGYPTSFFDFIYTSHVIEHLYNPRETLQEFRRIIKPNGYLVIITPDISGRLAKLTGKYWLGFDIPRHIHVFSSSHLEKLCNAAGFEVVGKKRIFPFGIWVLEASFYLFLHSRFRLKVNWLWRPFQRFSILDLPFYVLVRLLGLYDMSEFILRPR
jgi:SAM-dependent methyltransferase